MASEAESFSDAADVLLSNFEEHYNTDSLTGVTKSVQALAWAQLAVAARLGEIADALRESRG